MTKISIAADNAELALDLKERVKLKLLRRAANAGRNYFHATTDGQYLPERAHCWTSGFWPGLLRLLLTEVDDPQIARDAKQAEDGLFAILQTEDFFEFHHDVGFQFLPTAVMRYKQTGDAEARRRGIIAAQLLMGRFNIQSGVVEAWNADDRRGFAIIDTLMNLPLLFWATETTGEPRFSNLANAHIQAVIRDFVQDDLTVHHIVAYDQTGGQKLGARGGQGNAPDSAWTRGQAWAVYGLAIAARYTGDQSYLELSRKVADRFQELNEPHGVPPWDFRVVDAANTPRDSSAGAIFACGLLELASLGDPNAFSEANDQIFCLANNVLSLDDDQDGLLLKGTSALPTNKHVGDSLIYGDYYFYEALQRLNGINQTCW